jgi:hypothetical protein
VGYSTYLGFKYSPAGDGKWQLTLPSGVRSKVSADDEAALKAIIDSIVEGAED